METCPSPTQSQDSSFAVEENKALTRCGSELLPLGGLDVHTRVPGVLQGPRCPGCRATRQLKLLFTQTFQALFC